MNRHGNISSSWEGEILILDVTEAFNEDGVEYWFTELKKTIKARGLNSWKRLAIWDDEVLGSLESIDKVKSMYGWYEENGCTHTAVVVSNGIQAQIIKDKLKSGAKVFRDKEEALEWLKSE